MLPRLSKKGRADLLAKVADPDTSTDAGIVERTPSPLDSPPSKVNDPFSVSLSPVSPSKETPPFSPEKKECMLEDTPEKAALKIQLAQYQAQLNELKNGRPDGMCTY